MQSSTSTAPSGRVQLRFLALALPACLVLSSCFTLGLWGFVPRSDDRGKHTWKFEKGLWDEEDIAWYWRILLTPLTLTADCVTICFQIWLFADDDDHVSPRRRRRGC